MFASFRIYTQLNAHVKDFSFSRFVEPDALLLLYRRIYVDRSHTLLRSMKFSVILLLSPYLFMNDVDKMFYDSLNTFFSFLF